MMVDILNSAILNSAILDSAILVLPLKHTHTCQDWFPPFAQKKLHSLILTQFHDGGHLEFCHLEFHHLGFSHLSFSSQTHSYLPRLVPTICTKKLHSHFPPHHLHKKTSLIHSDSTWWWWPSWILPSWILPTLDSASVLWNSDTLFSSLRFTQKHSPSTLTLTQTNSIWLKLIHSDSTWWWQQSWILPTWFKPFCTKNITHSFWLNLMMAAILNLAILDSGILVFPLKPTHTCQDWFPPFAEKKIHSHFPHKFRIWLNLIQFDSNSFILIQLDDDSHLEFCHLGFSHFGQIKLHSFILT